ncbi:hypothetical protein C8C83_0208 [Flavobacterium sp. 90]|uniref:hypothetical protein n=1 Tax=unclassified Flavobacterium TaxID=196869 RepID=UPI000EB05695|nr:MULTISPECIES: hypothetical protein [unclassified Flavobacterium]RKR08625.1 hypothetical protein C8C82_0502 [Flavobacterium sp. 81]TCK52414.1 hypothetical protein C8C83_0208 [Flavobacterium sp. 90]
MKEKESLITQLTELLNKPGGKQAARFILNSLGAIPYVGGVFAASGNLWGEKEQHNFNDKLVEWIESTNTDLVKVLQYLDSELKEPTKANFSLLIGEALGIEIPFMIEVGVTPQVAVILHPQTLQEFEKYQKAGWITITSNGNIVSMGANNSVGNSIEDKKRPFGLGNGFIISLNESYYE